MKLTYRDLHEKALKRLKNMRKTAMIKKDTVKTIGEQNYWENEYLLLDHVIDIVTDPTKITLWENSNET